MKALLNLLKKAYPFSYRVQEWKSWKNFLFGEGKFMDPINALKKNKDTKTLIIHGEDDSSIPLILNKALISDIPTNNKIEFFIASQVGHSLSTYTTEAINEITKFSRS